jgi:hypothetical protein
MVINNPKMLVNPRKIKNKHKKNKSKTKVRGKKRNPSSATVVVALIILQRSAKYPNTWLTCTRNPSKEVGKDKG